MTLRRARRRPGENRVRLLEAGIIEFGLRGFDGASTKEIARRAEVPQPHVYQHFTSKSVLFLACLERVAEGLAPDAGGGTTHGIKSDPASSTTSVPIASEDDLRRFHFQAMTQAGDPLHGGAVQSALTRVRDTLSHRQWEHLIVQGAKLLLNH